MINAGVPGITTDVVLESFPALLDRHRPHVVVTMLGINDGLVEEGTATTRRLPAFDSLRVVKLLHLLVAHLRAAVGGRDGGAAVPHPVVTEALREIAAGRYDAGEARLREVASGPEAPPDVARSLVVVLTGVGKFSEGMQVVRDWLAAHPGDDAMRDLAWQVQLARVGWVIEHRQLDEAEGLLATLERELPAVADRHRAALLGHRAALADLRGASEAAQRDRAAAEALRLGGWRPPPSATIAGWSGWRGSEGRASW